MALSLVVVGDAEIKRLGGRFLGRPRVTDVLAFPLERESPDPAEPEGEIVINGELARREAATRRRPLRDELALYAVHGVLHLAGLDDLTPEGACVMKRRESQILTRLGLGEGR
jgi:probable rRNA maturation factor